MKPSFWLIGFEKFLKKNIFQFFLKKKFTDNAKAGPPELKNTPVKSQSRKVTNRNKGKRPHDRIVGKTNVR